MSEERFATDLYAAVAGPDATFFSAGNGNLVPAGAASALSISSLTTAFSMLWKQVDKDGNPIFTGRVRLVVPPALAVTARNIMNTTQLMAASGGGTGVLNDQLTVNNWVPAQIDELDRKSVVGGNSVDIGGGRVI